MIGPPEVHVFTETLKQVVDEAGALGAAVLSVDGLLLGAVDAQGQSVPADAAHREYATVFKQLLFVGDALPMGEA